VISYTQSPSIYHSSNLLLFKIPQIPVDAARTMLFATIPSLLSQLLAVYLPLTLSLTLPELRHRTIYQVFTDRFARTDDDLAECDPGKREYCGGSWKGIERKLVYIQDMGFDTGQRWFLPTPQIGILMREDSLDLAGGSQYGEGRVF